MRKFTCGHRKHMIYGFRNYYDMITWHNSFHILWYPFKFACIPRKCYCLSEEDSKHSRQTSARVFPYPEKILMISLEHSHDFLVLYCLQLSHTHNNIEWHGCHDCTTVSVVYNFEIPLQGFRTLVKILTAVPVAGTSSNILCGFKAKIFCPNTVRQVEI